MRRLSLLVAALVLVAGCPGAAGDSGATTTLTPVPVPTTATEEYPPGVTANGVSGPALADAHEQALEGTSYTSVVRHRIVGPNGTTQWTNRTIRVLAGGETFAGRYSLSAGGVALAEPPRTASYWTSSLMDPPAAPADPAGGPGAIEYWVDSDGFASRQLRAGRVVTTSWSATGTPLTDLDRSRSINRSVRALRFSVRSPEPGVYVLRVTGTTDPDALPAPTYLRGASNVSGAVRVLENGLVTDWRVAYDATRNHRTVRVIREGHVRNVGTTTVERPGWVAAARTDSGR